MRLLFYNALAFSGLLISFCSNAQVTVHSENFSGSIGTWTAVDVADAGNQWTASGGVMQIDGTGGSDDEDWLVSPSINMNLQTDEYFMFDYFDVNPGNLIELYYSVDYNGNGSSADVTNATWTNIPLRVIDLNTVSCFTNLLQRHPAIDISAISGTSVYFAFKYTGTAAVAKRYQLDNVRIEAEYYGSLISTVAGGSRCAGLKTEIHDVILNQTRIQYTSSSYDIWDAMLQTDRRMNDAGTAYIVWDMFTDIPSGTGEYEFDHCANRDNGSCPSGEGVCYNREHSFPKSWWGGGTSATDTQYVDMNHIMPADRLMNIYKSNYPPGIVETVSSSGSNGFKVGTNSTYRCSSMSYFEPIDEYKGDYARIYLYMATRYEHNLVAWSSLTTGGGCAMSGDTYPGFQPWLLQVLLDWHTNDPVSQKEIDRNNAVYAIQGNRNPYIDNPQWIEYVWGNSTGAPCSSVSVEELNLDSQLDVYPNPTNDMVTVSVVGKQAQIHVKICNELGQVVKATTFSNTNQFDLELEGKTGIYILELQLDGNHTVRKRIVKN